MTSDLKSAVSRPKYRMIAEAIRADILAGRLEQRDRLPSFTELQARFGATTSTANQVYAVLEREGLVAREPGRGVFVKTARRAGTGIVALSGWAFIERHKSSYWQDLFQGIEAAAGRAGMELLLTKPGSNSIKWELIDGALICEAQNDATAANLPPGMPCVTLLLPIDGIASVTTDDYRGMRAAMEHLLALGHRRIAYLSEGGQVYWTRRRSSAYRDALEEAGIEFEPRWLRRMPVPLAQPGGFRRAGRETLERWLRDGWSELGCTALLVHNDDAALGALEALAAGGIDVPRDLSVIGFDGLPEGEFSIPPLTTVRVPLTQVGELAVENLVQQMQGEVPAPVAINLNLPCQLVVRESTRPARTMRG